ncbi:hypothetical protein BCR42DRAFT_412250 [Absidia repens]|uniref:Zn(2)-C6 fungal-type domain-containing protein n=1 Tax=Absidia repens TaxID=90262 RepID=A0A1X2IJG2_9FUNG|nr:hypothetical protein BCR42DRAFT_412250 [Absidia repens]
MSRIRPCEYCKRRRRKCERPLGATTCVRCSRLNLDCIFDTRSVNNYRYNTSLSRDSTPLDDSMTELDDDNELEDLCQYMKTLEEEMKQLQLDIDQQRQQNEVIHHHHHQQQQQNNSLTPTTTSQLDAITLPKEWNLTIVNGHLRLETGINTLSDLLRYRQIQIETSMPIRYLSPLNNTCIRFEMQEDTVAFLLTQHEFFNQSLNSPPTTDSHQMHLGHVPISSNDFTAICPSSSMSNEIPAHFCDSTMSKMLSGTTFDYPNLLVDLLVRQYFQCYNPVLPFVHQSTFMAHYANQPLTNPTPSATIFDQQASIISQQSPITLAICCFMCITYCKHLNFTSHQKREYGEYYYVICRAQIDDLFDDPSPHRQLEALISINLLHKFTTTTLRLRDTRKLASLGFLLSVELLKHAAQPDSILTDVEKELISRHAIIASYAFTMAEFICVKRIDDILPAKVRFKILPGESEMTASMLELYTKMCDLVLDNYYCRRVIQELRRAVIGQAGYVNLEDMIQFEQKCLHWWKDLPKKWRYCESPFDLSAKVAIELCEYEQALMAHGYVLVLTLGVHTALISPQSSQGQVPDMIQKRAVMMTLKCCELWILITDRMKTITGYCGYTCEYNVNVYDSLRSLWNHSQRTGDKIIMPIIMKCFAWLLNDLNDMIPMDNLLPSDMPSIFKAPVLPSSSPAAYSNIQSFRCNRLGDGVNSSDYAKYPLPSYAILFDIISSATRNIDETLPSKIGS